MTVCSEALMASIMVVTAIVSVGGPATGKSKVLTVGLGLGLPDVGADVTQERERRKKREKRTAATMT